VLALQLAIACGLLAWLLAQIAGDIVRWWARPRGPTLSLRHWETALRDVQKREKEARDGR
jgi:hypothetical protein